MNKLISIIIPVYNHINTLPKSINSILSQTYRPMEIIIVNDGSTDNFNDQISNIVNSVEKFALEIKIINQSNQGAPTARNRGFREAKGEYVIFWDADTVGKREVLERMVESLENNPNKSYAYSGFRFGWKKFKAFKFDPNRLKKFNYIDITSLIRKKDFIEFDEGLKKFQDWDLWLTMLEQGKTGVYIPEILYKKIVGKRQGISSWLPKLAYKLFPKNKKVKEYQVAKEIIIKKHNL